MNRQVDGEDRRHVDEQGKRKKRPKWDADQDSDRAVGDRIRRLRIHELEIPSQVEFADRLGVSRGAVGNWEAGQGVKRASLERIAETFEVSLAWLASGHGQPKQTKSLESRIRDLLMPSDEADDFLELVELLLQERVRQLRNRRK